MSPQGADIGGSHGTMNLTLQPRFLFLASHGHPGFGCSSSRRGLDTRSQGVDVPAACIPHPAAPSVAKLISENGHETAPLRRSPGKRTVPITLPKELHELRPQSRPRDRGTDPPVS